MKYHLILWGALFFIFNTRPLYADTLFFGDSLTASYGDFGRKLINDNVKVEYVSGSGLLNDSKKNWLHFVNNTDLSEYDNVIISLGTNDFVKYSQNDYNEYYIRLFNLISEIQNQNPLVTIIWLSPPHLKNVEHEKYLISTREIIKNGADIMQFHYIDINRPHILGTDWQSVVDGQKVRTDDGIHITQAGSRRVISELVKSMNQYENNND
ncbi:SGNH/GDSL hydrolase family protein [Proteus columbae]|uniref:SGNH/GDSL hydrolase family protein n=1 Tax=Proteus columbae TaxID=1987580 RepID=UPI00288C1745|nr:SGNH/GDSL hydrolase family protein [Proteus columbae]